jgi:hypothetical protein
VGTVSEGVDVRDLEVALAHCGRARDCEGEVFRMGQDTIETSGVWTATGHLNFGGIEARYKVSPVG